jgi:DNA-binding transcriptional ArsR family regulator
MVERTQPAQVAEPAALDTTYAALADPTRRAIFEHLGAGEARVTDVARRFPVSLNAVSKHIRCLERAGLVSREIRGREHFLAADAGPLELAGSWIEHHRRFWEERVDALAAHLASGRAHPPAAGTAPDDRPGPP